LSASKKNAPPSTAAYRPEAAGAFWSRRLKVTDPLAAVLTFDAPVELNQAYDRWERHTLRRLLPSPLDGKRALDIGCGIGRIAVEVARLGAEVIAVDVSEAMLAECRANARRRRVASRVQPVVGSADRLPVDSRFDIITCFGLLEHLPPAPRRVAMQQAFELLKARGKMFVVVNNHRNVFLGDSYCLKAQREDGYFVGLVGLDWVRRLCDRQGMRLVLRAANSFYALAHYHLLPHRATLALTKKEIGDLCRLAGALDLDHPLDGPLADRFASHFLIEITRKR